MTTTPVPFCAHSDVGGHADECPCSTPPPADATTVHGWTRRPSSDLPGRAFVGTVREAAGFAIAVQGAQRSNGTATRYVSIDVSGARPDAFTGCVALDVEAVRQLAAMLRDAADEVDRLRCAR